MRAPLSVAAPCLAAIVAIASCTSDPIGPEGGRTGTDLIVIHPSAATLQGGQTLHLNVSALGDGAQEFRAADVIWSSRDARVAGVSSEGVVEARDAGTVEIKAWWRGKEGTATMVVLQGRPSGPSCLKPLSTGHGGGGCLAP